MTEANIHRATTWAEVDKIVSLGMYFHAPTLKMRGELLQVLSDPRGYLYGWRDEFANMIIAAQDARKAHYMSGGGRDGWQDITYYITRDGNALLAIRRDGAVLVNESAMSGDKRYADAIKRLRPILETLVSSGRKHWLYGATEELADRR